MKKIVTLLLLLQVTVNIFSDSFQTGNLEFTNKNYNLAVDAYLEDITENGYNVNALFNLGNSYIKLDRYGDALFVLYRAKLLYPRDTNINLLIEELEKNLGLENKFLNSKFISFRENWILTLSILTLFSVVLFLISYLSYKKSTNNLLYRLRKVVIISLSLILILSITGNFLDYTNKNSGIVLNNSEIYISPYPGSEKSYKAKEGVKVNVTDEFENFYSILEDDGKYGWIEKESLGLLWK